ncbi:hypothetical protein [Agromyces sp. NPDC057865]|uniref:hypothetical protein n=1 Tax=Agromyces sp. NPDC057865 TaxID=3346267 RepID=UPI00367186C6
MTVRSALGRGRLTFKSGVVCDLTLVEVTEEHLIVRARSVSATSGLDLVSIAPTAEDESGGVYRFFSASTGGGAVSDVVEWVYQRPDGHDPKTVTVTSDTLDAITVQFD